MGPWRFDFASAAVGALAAFLLMGLARLLRTPLARLRQQAQETTRQAVERATATAEVRYREHLANWARSAHALSHLAPLDALFVEPSLLPPSPHPDPTGTLPRHRRPVRLGGILGGHPRIALLGGLGSGRTSALLHLALSHAQEPDGASSEQGYLPLFLRLTDLEWNRGSEGNGQEEPSTEQLIRAALQAVEAGGSFAPALRQALADGRALVLADGWDDLDADRREAAARWLAGLAEEVPGNIWVVAAGQRGHAPLVDAGFTPLRLMHWQPSQVETLLDRWRAALGEDGSQAAADSNALIDALKAGAGPLELNLRAWLLLTDGAAPTLPGEVFLQTADRALESLAHLETETWLPAAARAALGRLALALQREGRRAAHRQEVADAFAAALPPEAERPTRAVDRLTQTLLEVHLLDKGPSADTYAFPHPLWQAFWAARQLTTLPAEALLDHLDDPDWEPVIGFYAELGPMERVVEAWLGQPDDLWHHRLIRAAGWVSRAPKGARWRNGVMALLARTLLRSDVPLPIRQRLTDALVGTGDPGVRYFLKQAVQHPTADVRFVALRALGYVGGEGDLEVLEIGLADQDPRIRAAAVEALGLMGTRAAVHRLTQLLVEADQELRVEAARALARCGEEGWEVLTEALQEEDLLTRRAAVYGLAETGLPWVWERLAQVAQDDPEWLVRSAAETLLEAEERRPHPVQPPPVVSEMGWLIAWAAERGEAVGRGEAAFPVLLRALREGSPEVRRAAIEALGLVGRPEHIPALQGLLEEDVETATAALEAMEEIVLRHDLSLQ